MLVLNDGELVDHQPIVVLGIVKIEEVDRAPDDAPLVGMLDGDAVDEEAVELAVGRDEGGGRQAGKLAEGVIESGFGDGRVEALKRGAQAGGKEHLGIGGTLGAVAIAGQVRAEGAGVAQAGEPVEGGLLNVGFGKGHKLRFSLLILRIIL